MQSSSSAIRRTATALVLAGLGAAMAGCTPASLVFSAVGIATDTNLTWNIVKHVHAKLTEDDPVACRKLDSVQRALSTRCGEFVAGSLQAKDIDTASLQACPLMVATRDPRLWPVLPELLAKGARVERCADSPLLALAQLPVWQGCADFSGASPAVKQALVQLAETDPRAVRHDVVRMVSCPSARQAGLDQVLRSWRTAGLLQPQQLGFGLMGALHPDYLDSPFARRLESEGHTAQAALRPGEGSLPSGFEAALRGSHWAALDWWLARAPELANVVPGRHAGDLPWLPLAKVVTPGFLPEAASQADAVGYLLARGADPRQRLPYSSDQTVLAYAKSIDSPVLALLDRQPVLAANGGGGGGNDSVRSGNALRLAGR